MGEVKSFDPRQAQRAAVLRKTGDRVGAGEQCAAAAFVDGPGSGGGHVGDGVGVGQAFQVAGQERAALFGGEVGGEGGVGVGEDGA